MSRSGYSDDYGADDPWGLIRYRGAVASAIRGKRGQRLLQDIADFMDAMPEKRLVRNTLQNVFGEVCALGAAAKKRGVDISALDPEDEAPSVAGLLDIADALAREVTWINDDCSHHAETPEIRWMRVRAWVRQHLKTEEGSR